MEQIDWKRWKREDSTPESEIKDVRLEILSLRILLNQMRRKRLSAELRSNVHILWQIGSNVLHRYIFGNECIQMLGMLAFFGSTPVDVTSFESEENRQVILMLKDVGFVITTGTSLISTKFPELMDEIREKNPRSDVNVFEKIIAILSDDGRTFVSYKIMTPIWQHVLLHVHGIKLIQKYSHLWEEYLRDLLRHEHYRLKDIKKEIMTRAIGIFDSEYGCTDMRTMELRFIQLDLFLREFDARNFLSQSSHYRSLLETILRTTQEPARHFLPAVFVPQGIRYPIRDIRRKPHIIELIYLRALRRDDPKSKTLLLQEALAYCVLGNNLWRSTFPDNQCSKNTGRNTADNGGDVGDVFLSWRLKCLAELGRLDEMVACVKEIREILMDPPLLHSTPWFPDTILEFQGGGREMILNELSILLNHFYNIGYHENEYILKSLIKCECELRKWDRISVVMREKRKHWREVISSAKVIGIVPLESFMLNLITNFTNDLEVDELVNESLEFIKYLVEFFINDGAYGEKYLVDLVGRSPIDKFKNDPLVLVIKTCLFKNWHDELSNYMLEYEKLLEEKYGDRVGPITNGILLFGEWTITLLKTQRNIGEEVKVLLQRVKSTIQHRIIILSNHPTESNTWMKGYAVGISRDCHSFHISELNSISTQINI